VAGRGDDACVSAPEKRADGMMADMRDGDGKVHQDAVRFAGEM
jgi:hypothetical protein